MRSLILLLALLAPQCAFAQGATADAEAAKRAMEAEAKRQGEAARLQHPVLRYPDPGSPPYDDLVAHAAFLERQGRGPEAVKMYVRAARGGSANAARRLFEIYDKGIPGVERDYVESLKWANVARALSDLVR